MARKEKILNAMRAYTGRRTKKDGLPYIRSLRKQSGVKDITLRERADLWPLKDKKEEDGPGTFPFDAEKALTDPRYRIKSKGTLGPGGMLWEKWDAISDADTREYYGKHYIDNWKRREAYKRMREKEYEERNK